MHKLIEAIGIVDQYIEKLRPLEDRRETLDSLDIGENDTLILNFSDYDGDFRSEYIPIDLVDDVNAAQEWIKKRDEKRKAEAERKRQSELEEARRTREAREKELYLELKKKYENN